MNEIEGVTKFEARHRSEPLAERSFGEAVAELSAWRSILRGVGAIGCEPLRYGGAGFGNLSRRVGVPSRGRGQRAMLITCSQTGDVGDLGLADCCVVESYDIERNLVRSRGVCRPSSETMTHGAVYDVSPSIRAVAHGHLPSVWHQARRLRLPQTRAEVGYGTPEMAREVERLFCESSLAETRVFVMAGHEDGVVAFGRSLEEASLALIAAMARALALPSSSTSAAPYSIGGRSRQA